MPLTTATKAARLSVAPMMDRGDIKILFFRLLWCYGQLCSTLVAQGIRHLDELG